jgi:hypothetical protein
VTVPARVAQLRLVRFRAHPAFLSIVRPAAQVLLP